MATPPGRSRPADGKTRYGRAWSPGYLSSEAVAEKISARGIRVATEHVWGVGSIVLLTSPELGIHSEARVVYCQYAVGLELLSQEKEWTKPN